MLKHSDDFPYLRPLLLLQINIKCENMFTTQGIDQINKGINQIFTIVS